jgi:acyl phosphate:glycerol-3-phosphate acyltransferase
MWPKFAVMIVGAYLLGSIPAAYLGVKWFKGQDIRKLGTGNVGSSNVARSTSKVLAVPIALFDMGKGAFAVWIAHLVGLSAAQQLAVGFVTIVGHNWSVFIGFHGGKGMVTTLGIIAYISPLLAVIIVFISYLPAVIRQMAPGVAVALISLPFWSWFAWGWFQSSRFGAEARTPVTFFLIAAAVMGFARRLIGPRVELSKDVPSGQLLLNRLVFDRDIRDRNAWIDRQTVKPD